MKTKNRPMESHTAIIESFLEFADVSEEERSHLKKELERYITVRLQHGKWCHPLITKFHTDWYREFYRIVDKKDPYEAVKRRSNEVARAILERTTPANVREATLLAIIGNEIDFGAVNESGVYDLQRLENEITHLQDEELLIDDIAELLRRIEEAENVFYLVDNNGEVVFDTLLLDYIGERVDKSDIYLVGKEDPMLNDVTAAELETLGFEKYGTILSTGSNCFGLHEEEVSREFKKRFEEADLIIAKGQAYFEFFMHYNFENVMHLLRVKHEITGENIPDLPSGANVVMSSAQYAGDGFDYRWD